MHAHRLGSFLFGALSLLVFGSPALSAEPVPCRDALRTEGVVLRECSTSPTEREVHLHLSRAGGSAVTLRASFDLALSDRVFRRLSGNGEDFTAEDLAAIRESASRADPLKLSTPARALLSFAAQFVEPGFRVPDQDLTALAKASAGRLTSATTMICDRLTKPQRATFTAAGQAWQQIVVVGSDGCMGKCGVGCAPDGLWYQGQYTQECLNHDACATFTKDNMGDCQDEFWAAAGGFLNGPSCMYPAGPPHLEPPAPYKAPRKKRRHS